MTTLISLRLLTWTLEGSDQETNFNLSLHIDNTSRAWHFHLIGILNNIAHMGLTHIGMTNISTTSSHNKFSQLFIWNKNFVNTSFNHARMPHHSCVTVVCTFCNITSSRRKREKKKLLMAWAWFFPNKYCILISWIALMQQWQNLFTIKKSIIVTQ